MMTQLLLMILKDKLSLVLCTPKNDQQIILATTPIPTNKTKFQKFFNVSTTHIITKNQSNICVSCHLLSNQSLSSIKFKSMNNHLLAWLNQAQVFTESDSLGTACPATISYLTKIATDITNLPNLYNHLVNQLMLIELNPATTISLAPHLKQAQLKAISNSDDYILILPDFELYCMQISHGHDPSKITTDVIGIKSAPKDTKLLAEFFMWYAAEMSNNTHNGAFLPKSTVNLLGSTTYAQVLKDNNLFLTQVVTIPINLKHNTWFAIIDPNATSNDVPISLHNHLL